MISTNQFRAGIAIVMNGQLHLVIESQHVKPGKGPAFVRTKLRNIRTGSILSKTFSAGEKFQEAFIAKRPLQFLYRAENEYHFMDLESYEQHVFDGALLGDAVHFLTESLEVTGEFHESQLVGLELPTTVVLKVTGAEPGVRGDTSKAGMKPATLETGYKIQIPLFIGPQEKVKVDTRSGEYVGRA